MSIISTEEFLRKGHQVDLDMMNLDSAIKGLSQESAIPSADLSTWRSLYSEWAHYYEKNIKDTPILPWQDSEDLDTWLTRIESWKLKVAKWGAAKGGRASQIVHAIPESPAVIEHRENPPSSKGLPVWAYMLFATALLGTVGYTLAGVAKVSGR